MRKLWCKIFGHKWITKSFTNYKKVVGVYTQCLNCKQIKD
jgi:hypothetical protein